MSYRRMWAARGLHGSASQQYPPLYTRRLVTFNVARNQCKIFQTPSSRRIKTRIVRSIESKIENFGKRHPFREIAPRSLVHSMTSKSLDRNVPRSRFSAVTDENSTFLRPDRSSALLSALCRRFVFLRLPVASTYVGDHRIREHSAPAGFKGS